MLLHRVEYEGIYWPNMIDIIDSLPMALEGILLVLGVWHRIKVFHCNPTLDGCSRVAWTTEMSRQAPAAKEEDIPCPSAMHAKALVINFRLLSRGGGAGSILRIS